MGVYAVSESMLSLSANQFFGVGAGAFELGAQVVEEELECCPGDIYYSSVFGVHLKQ